ncbi:MAG: hypothetical protein K6A95_04920 [Bacteroidales bacterium]|jgi:hypothetical protein|nr:hypothetical protein [Bacteroidales bacterium]
MRTWPVVALLLLLPLSLLGQDVGEVEWKKVIVKEWSVNAFLTTHGGGVGFQHGRTPNYYDKHFWEIDFHYNLHYKAVRARSYFNAKAYAYGKMCDLFFLHGGYGYQRTIHQKPYWGGVRIRYTLSGGFSLGLAVPVYLYVAQFDNTTGLYTSYTTERYEPGKHNIDNIVSRAPFFKGIGHTQLRPGFYFKTGLNFDFSKDEYTMHALEVGGLIDMVFPFVQQMAYNKAKPFHLCAYIAYHFGKRKGNYE